MKRRKNPDTLGNPEGIANGVLNYLTKGLTARAAAQFRAYHTMQVNGISLTPNQREHYQLLKSIAQRELEKRWTLHK